MRKTERTMERYMKSGAMMRLYKTLGAHLLAEISAVVSAADQEKMMRAMKRIDEVCSNAEDNMFRDFPQLPDQYIDVFYGSTKNKPLRDLDAEIIALARETADDMFK